MEILFQDSKIYDDRDEDITFGFYNGRTWEGVSYGKHIFECMNRYSHIAICENGISEEHVTVVYPMRTVIRIKI